jgi:hypothetical protein
MTTLGNLVHETSVSTDDTTWTIAAVNGKQRISELFTRLGLGFGDNGAANPILFLSNRDAAEWAVVQAYLSDANTLVIASTIESSNGDATVSWSAGTKDVCNDVPASAQNSSEDYGLVTGAVTLEDDYGSVA